MKYFFLSISLIAVSAYATYYLLTQTQVKNLATNTPLAQLIASPSPALTIEIPPLPVAKTLTGGTQVFQTFNNCGPASLSMALSHYGITVSQAELGQALRPYQHPQGDNDDKSVTLIELAKKAEEYGFIAYYRPGGDIGTIQHFIAHEMPVITRTWLSPTEDIGHYRVVKGYNQNLQVLIQDDSLQGKNLHYSYADFEEIWKAFNYEFLVLVPAEKKEIAEAILGDRVDEQTAWSHALSIATDDFNRSIALYHLGRYEESITAYEKVAPSLPRRMLWYQIEPLLAYYQVGNYERVLSMSEQILNDENRAYSELHQLRGLVFEKQENSQLAEEEFAKAEYYNSSSHWKNNL